MVAALYETLKNNIETELSVNNKKKNKKKSQVYKQCHLKKVFYSTGVCKADILNIFSFLTKSNEWYVCNCIKKLVYGISPENKNH